MSNSPTRPRFGSVAAIVGFLLLPVLCCVAPLLIGAGALGLAGTLGVIGATIGNPWVIAAGGALVAGVMAWFLRRRYISVATKNACRVPSQAMDTEIGGCRHSGRDA